MLNLTKDPKMSIKYIFDSFEGPTNVTSKLCSLCFNLLINLTCSYLICLSNMMKIKK